MSLVPAVTRTSLRGDELSRHDGESDRWALRFDHPNLERAGAMPHPASRAGVQRRTPDRQRAGHSDRPR